MSDLKLRSTSAPDFRALFESAPGLYLVLTSDLVIVAASEAYLAATMTRREDLLGRGIFDAFPDNPDDPAATGVANLRASLERVLSQLRPDAMAVQKYDIRRPESEGGGFEVRHWSPVNSPVLGPDGKIAYIIHRVEDVTEFIRLKERGSEQHKLAEELKTKAGQMESEIYRRAQEIQEANRRLRELQSELEKRVEIRTAALTAANQELEREVMERRRTEEALRRSEEQLRQAQKLEAVGRLAGGVAHDFNNLLTVVLSYSEELLENLPPSAPMRAELSEIQRAGQRASDLTRQLLAFSRQQLFDPVLLDLNEILSSIHVMLKRVLGEDIELILSLASEIHKVKADRGLMEQVVMNLVVNSRDAMPQGGKLVLQTSNENLSEEYASDHLGVSAGRYVALTISDTGIGMDEETRARAFEPFFTTKERGRGTGLGLSTVFGIVKQTGGSVWLYSEPGAGTTFKIYLPKAEGVGAPVVPAAPEQPHPVGTETILLAEDEEQVRRVALTILRRAGYVVIEASSPAEALQISERWPTPIHLLLTDVVMPRMNGRELADRVLASRPSTKVLFMSGYTDDVILHHGGLDPGVAFMQKPLTPASLTRKVRQVLDTEALSYRK